MAKKSKQSKGGFPYAGPGPQESKQASISYPAVGGGSAGAQRKGRTHIGRKVVRNKITDVTPEDSK